MRTVFTILYAFITCLCLAQQQKQIDVLVELTIPYRPATITLIADNGLSRSSFVNNSSKIILINIKPGHYKIQVSGSGQLPVVKDSVTVFEGQQLVINFKIVGPCLYDHPAEYIPTCPQNHRDSIIPIMYGLIVARGNIFVKDKKRMKVMYAGCVVTGCDPQFYCKVHDIKF